MNGSRHRSRVRRLIEQNNQSQQMKNFYISITIASALALFVVLIKQELLAQKTNPRPGDNTDSTIAEVAAPKSNNAGEAPIFVTEIPPGYRDWRLVSVAREEGTLDDIRAILGNDVAIKAYREGTRPFPEGTIIARLAWSLVPSEENNKTFGQAQSFVAGSPKNGVQFMVKNSLKYASSGGWGYGQFDDGKPADTAMMKSCFPCHEAFKDRDFVFTHYAP
jgi:hypothetical protein